MRKNDTTLIWFCILILSLISFYTQLVSHIEGKQVAALEIRVEKLEEINSSNLLLNSKPLL